MAMAHVKLISGAVLLINCLFVAHGETNGQCQQLSDKLAVMESQVSQLTETIMLHQQRNDEQDKVFQLLKETEKRRRQSEEEIVAFTARKSRTQPEVSINQHILFDDVLINLGAAYQDKQGLFIAPQSGVYVFSVSILSTYSSDEEEFHAALVHNGDLIARIYGCGSPGRHDQAGQTVILQLETGDEVWIENIELVSDVWGAYYSTFSGYLLSPL